MFRNVRTVFRWILTGRIADATLLRNPEERSSAAELRKHPYLILPAGWRFTGFA